MLRNTSCEQLDLFQNVEYHRIPKNHILLRIDSEISLAFVNDLLAHKYHKTFGRPAWKPEVMVRIGILQKMYNLSDEAVIDEIAVNRACEYFCHLSPMDELPHPSSLCKFRKMRLDENIMDDILTCSGAAGALPDPLHRKLDYLTNEIRNSLAVLDQLAGKLDNGDDPASDTQEK